MEWNVFCDTWEPRLNHWGSVKSLGRRARPGRDFAGHTVVKGLENFVERRRPSEGLIRAIAISRGSAVSRDNRFAVTRADR